MSVIEVRNLRKNYGPLAAVDGVDLSIARGMRSVFLLIWLVIGLFFSIRTFKWDRE